MNAQDYTYDVLSKYFSELSSSGYVKNKELKKMILLDMIIDLCTNDYQGCLKPEDYQILTALFNGLFSSSCFFSFPNTCI